MSMSWDLWIDYHRRDSAGLTHASVKDVEPEFSSCQDPA